MLESRAEEIPPSERTGGRVRLRDVGRPHHGGRRVRGIEEAEAGRAAGQARGERVGDALRVCS